MSTSTSPSKQRLLKAAAEITALDGAANLTLDKVAERAGVSKGGLLYHYPNKQALLERGVQAERKGIFGAPSFVTTDGELFWGDDRLEHSIEWVLRRR